MRVLKVQGGLYNWLEVQGSKLKFSHNIIKIFGETSESLPIFQHFTQKTHELKFLTYPP